MMSAATLGDQGKKCICSSSICQACSYLEQRVLRLESAQQLVLVRIKAQNLRLQCVHVQVQ